MDDKIRIVLITDKNYFFPAMVTIDSLLNNTEKNVEIAVVVFEKKDYSVYSKQYEKKYPNATVEFIFFDENNIMNVQEKFHISKAAYVKIYLPEILSEWNKVIFLDSDLLVRKDIAYLWNYFTLFSTNDIIAAVRNPRYNDDNRYIGIDEKTQTFNSGVMLMDLEKMREVESTKKLELFLKKYNHLTKLNDQPAFNYAFKNSWYELPLEWNVQFSFFLKNSSYLQIERKELIALRKKPSILHFTTASKPWKYRSIHPYKKEFLRYYCEYTNYSPNKNFIDSLKKIREFFYIAIRKILV